MCDSFQLFLQRRYYLAMLGLDLFQQQSSFRQGIASTGVLELFAQ
jgi:hypothetical protein